MKKKNNFKKTQVWDLIGALMPYLYYFWKWKFFFISPKKSVGSSAFQKNLQRLDQPTLFFAFLKKITTTGSSHFLSPNGQG